MNHHENMTHFVSVLGKLVIIGLLVSTVSVVSAGSAGGNAGTTFGNNTIPTTQSLGSGNEGSSVGNLQMRLSEEGYYDGPITGSYDTATSGAVTLFQQAMGLIADGVAGAGTINVLNEIARDEVFTGAPIATGSGVAAGEGISTGGGISTGQGITTGSCIPTGGGIGTGSGVATGAAVAAGSGIITGEGIATGDGIISGQGIATGNPIPTGETLRPGDTNDQVSSLQDRLAEEGFYTGQITGTYDQATIDAVTNYQNDRDLTADGIAGGQTIAEINTDLEGRLATAQTIEGRLSTDQALRPGDVNDDVTTIQARLREEGYYEGSTTGTYDEATVNAVTNYQRDRGLTTDGIANVQTIAEINMDLDSRIVTMTPVRGQDRARQTLQPGTTSASVSQLQERLREEGHYDFEPTGTYDSTTTIAVENYQRDRGLTVDGVARPDTLATLNDSVDSGNSQDIQQNNGSSVNPCIETDQTLRPGTTADAVGVLQDRLSEEGYYSGSATGSYDEATTQAVADYQTDRGLAADGIAGGQTINDLNENATRPAGYQETDSRDMNNDQNNSATGNNNDVDIDNQNLDRQRQL